MAKILILSNHSYMLYHYRNALIRRLADDGHELVMAMPLVGHEDDFEKMGAKCINVDISRHGVNPLTDFRLFRNYMSIIKRERPALVMTYSIKPNIYAGLASKVSRIPYCAHVQGLGTAFQNKILAPIVTALYKIALKRVHTVFFENTANAKEFVDRKIIPYSKATVLNGAGVDLNDYPLTEYPENDVFSFAFLGRIMKDKGIDELFYAFEKLSDTYKGKVRLDLIGYFDDDYEVKIKEYTDTHNAVFHGFQKDTHKYYSSADCVVLPSYHEGMSNVLLEAAATGRPLITCDIPGCREAVDNGKNGILIPPKNAKALFDAMEKMFNMPAAERRQMGIHGNKKMKEQFQKQQVVDKTVDALPI